MCNRTNIDQSPWRSLSAETLVVLAAFGCIALAFWLRLAGAA